MKISFSLPTTCSLFLALLFLPKLLLSQNDNAGIGTTTPHASAKLDVTSINSGFLPPRMTTTQRDAIVNPTPGLMIFNSTTQSIDFFTLYGWSTMKMAIQGGNKLVGGNGDENNPRIQKTSDGGYIVAGISYSSTSGDVGGTTHGFSDYWIVRLNSSGGIIWNKLLGGNQFEDFYSIQQTMDGGFIVAGSSSSSANGDVTPTNHGSRDFWIVKLDGSGNIEWNQLLGGNATEEARSIEQTTDGGYIVAGFSSSSLSGNVSGTSNGSRDFWIVKLDFRGFIEWDRLLGGNASDEANSIQPTVDGGYIVAGQSLSSANGDVTGTNRGMSDYWIVKLGALGNIEWNRLMGGNNDEFAYSIRQAADASYVVAGFSNSSAYGDVTGTNHGFGNSDFWIIRLNSAGGTVWNKLLGGTDYDIAHSIQPTADLGYIVAGFSNSLANGNVSGVNHGGYDYWIVKLDRFGNILWNKVLGGNNDEIAYSIQQTADGGYIVCGTSSSSANGDVTAANHGVLGDFWIVRLDANGNIL